MLGRKGWIHRKSHHKLGEITLIYIPFFQVGEISHLHTNHIVPNFRPGTSSPIFPLLPLCWLVQLLGWKLLDRSQQNVLNSWFIWWREGKKGRQMIYLSLFRFIYVYIYIFIHIPESPRVWNLCTLTINNRPIGAEIWHTWRVCRYITYFYIRYILALRWEQSNDEGDWLHIHQFEHVLFKSVCVCLHSIGCTKGLTLGPQNHEKWRF